MMNLKAKKFIKFIAMTLLVVIFSVTFIGCGDNQPKEENTDNVEVENKLEKIKKSGKIVVGTCADYPPYEFHKAVDGKDEILGFDMAIANEIAKDLGVKLEIKDMSFDGLIAALQCDNVDIVIAGMNPTPDREKEVDFSKPYYTAAQGLIVRAEDKDKIKSLDDLEGKKVGVQKGTVQEDIAKEKMSKSDLKSLGKVTDLIMEIKDKKVDALLVELPVAEAYISKNKDIFLTDIEVENDEEGTAVAVKKGSTELVESINKTLDRLTEEDIKKFFIEATQASE